MNPEMEALRPSTEQERVPQTANEFFDMYPNLTTLVEAVKRERAPGTANQFPSLHAYRGAWRYFAEAEGAPELADDLFNMRPNMGTLTASADPEPARWVPQWLRTTCRSSIEAIVDIFKELSS
jgi:hypothetical protein